jgi:lactoylglutathione lyase
MPSASSSLRLAKPHLDVGLFTNDRERQLAFWRHEAGLTFDHMAKLGGGVQQHRFLALGSVEATIVKVNDSRDPLPEAPVSGLSELLIARASLTAPRALRDADGNRMALVPKGYDGIEAAAIRLTVNDIDATAQFYAGLLDFERLGPARLRCGHTLLILERATRRIEPSAYRAKGWRYMTVQVTDCDGVHARVLAGGGSEGRPPSTIGTTARISFVRDPDGTWIEISERASLTGAALRS